MQTIPKCPECGGSNVVPHEADCPKRAVHFDWSCDDCVFGFDDETADALATR